MGFCQYEITLLYTEKTVLHLLLDIISIDTVIDVQFGVGLADEKVDPKNCF